MFVELVRIGVLSNVKIMCRKTLIEKVDRAYFKIKTAVENKLTGVDVVSTTTNLWSKAKRLLIQFLIFLFYYKYAYI